LPRECLELHTHSFTRLNQAIRQVVGVRRSHVAANKGESLLKTGKFKRGFATPNIYLQLT
jgi:hypothetical protein